MIVPESWGRTAGATFLSRREEGSVRVRPLPRGLANSYSSLQGQHKGHFLREAFLTPLVRSVPCYTLLQHTLLLLHGSQGPR